MIGIYMYINRLNGKKYIGKSMNIDSRMKKHFRNANNGQESYFYNALRKYGKEQFDFIVLEECAEDKLDEREKYYIDFYDCMIPKGYNMTPGGDGGNVFGTKCEDEIKKIREKMSRSHIGLKHTEEDLLKMSLSQKGIPRPYAAGRTGWNKGKKMSREFREKISQSCSGNKNGMYGKKQSDLCRKVNSEIHKGQTPANKGKHLVWDDREKRKFHYE